MKKFLTLIFLSILTAGCSEIFPIFDIDPPPPSTCPSVILVDEFSYDQYPSDTFEILSAEVINNKLHIDVRFSGGCEEHQFKLYALKTFMESYPVQSPIYLSHNAFNDACDAVVTKELIFNISKIKILYHQMYDDNGPILLNIHWADQLGPFDPMPVYSW